MGSQAKWHQGDTVARGRKRCPYAWREVRARWWEAVGRALMRRRLPRWGLVFLRRATDLRPRDYRLWLRRAAAAMRAGDTEDALLCYRVLLRLQPHNPRAYWRLAMVYEFIGAPQAALEVCRQGLQEVPGAPCLSRQHARLLLHSSCPSAIAELSAETKAAAAALNTDYYLALALRAAGRREEARQVLTRALARHPHDPKLYYAFGLCCDPGDAEQAVACLLQGLAIEYENGLGQVRQEGG